MQNEIYAHLDVKSSIAANRTVKVRVGQTKIDETVRYLEDSKIEAYMSFPRDEEEKHRISSTTFYNYMNAKRIYKKATRLTDLCDYCEWAKSAKKKIKSVLSEEKYNNLENLISKDAINFLEEIHKTIDQEQSEIERSAKIKEVSYLYTDQFSLSICYIFNIFRQYGF